MNDITEISRRTAPTLRPQAIAFDGTQLWLGSVETDRLYAVSPDDWTVRDEIAVPGKPWGMTFVGDEIRVILGQTEEDHRNIFRIVPGRGVHSDGMIPCPDDTGSQLSYDGERLFVSQWYKQRLLAVDDAGKVGTIIEVPRGICGQTIVAGRFYLITTEDESKDEYFLTRVDARGAKPEIVDLATLHFGARGLAFDGEKFWTNEREKHETVSFAKPD